MARFGTPRCVRIRSETFSRINPAPTPYLSIRVRCACGRFCARRPISREIGSPKKSAPDPPVFISIHRSGPPETPEGFPHRSGVAGRPAIAALRAASRRPTPKRRILTPISVPLQIVKSVQFSVVRNVQFSIDIDIERVFFQLRFRSFSGISVLTP